MENNSKSVNKGIIIVLVVLIGIFIARYIVVGLVLLYGVVGDTVDIVETEESIIIDEGKMNISDVSGYYDEEKEKYVLTGYFVNNSEENYSVSVTYKLLDSNGIVLGEAYGNLGKLNADQTWKFKIQYVEEDAKDVCSYEIEYVDYYKVEGYN